MAALGMAFAAIVYLIFFATFLYLIAFVGNFPGIARTVDIGPQAPTLIAVAGNLGLMALFGVQHSVMARPGFKARWTRVVPRHLERSFYVLAASLALILLFYLWRPLPNIMWLVTWKPVALLLRGLFFLGWAVVLISTFLINHLELFGLRQAFAHLRGHDIPAPQFRTPFFYRHVRHPIYLGFLLAFWSTPLMTMGHFLFAAGMSVYILIGIRQEERDLVKQFGDQYLAYRRKVGKLFPGVH
ncbi:methanethiol S-methyltransferase [Sandaracinobacteroides hominis]|uniref:methanethiol S-methyltransferase n=1 Tax=Sandaracinobacteroides hominis TaxID=2780086 RepID=UPI0018F43711|nr:methanethiol S-methyltransferase [Sandaracinobacteroides hominis]